MLSMIRRTSKRLGATALLTAAALCAAASPASASFQNGYCGVLVPQGVWCSDGTDHTYDYNRAEYRGGGSVWVCEQLRYANTSTPRATPTCAYNYAAKNYGLTQYTLFEADVTHLYSGGANHTIYGYAVA